MTALLCFHSLSSPRAILELHILPMQFDLLLAQFIRPGSTVIRIFDRGIKRIREFNYRDILTNPSLNFSCLLNFSSWDWGDRELPLLNIFEFFSHLFSCYTHIEMKKNFSYVKRRNFSCQATQETKHQIVKCSS